jgi:uncharacterized protein with FMN-binding domain
VRRITLWALSTLTTLVLLFSYHTSTGGSGTATAAGTSVQAPVASGTDPGTTDSGTSDSGTSGSGTSGSGTSGSGTSGSGSSTSATTYTGDSVQTRWGPVQVRITVVDGTITVSEAIVYPDGNHEDREINAFALPVLNQEAVTRQSADIDMVSGATVTSEGYLQSLQSAIDQAHL